jgi:hypothetical protein
MATGAEWAVGYARQAYADLMTFEALQSLAIPQCHKLQFLQMCCEKLVKSYLCAGGTDPATLRQSHSYVAKTLPVVLRQQVIVMNLSAAQAREILRQARHLAQEIDVLAPAVKRGGHRPDKCEYPWEDDNGTLHVPLDWTFYPSLLLAYGGRTFLKPVRGAIDRAL